MTLGGDVQRSSSKCVTEFAPDHCAACRAYGNYCHHRIFRHKDPRLGVPFNPTTAVCLGPGTEIAFEENAYIQGKQFRWPVKDRLARFRQIDFGKPTQHHDALEFANGRIVR